MPADAAASAALLLFTLGFFAIAIVPESFTALLFFVFGTMGAIAPATILFSGFTTGAFWLVFAGLILGDAMKATGLADALARAMLLARAPRSYGGLVGLVALLSGLLCFIMPSTPARILLLLPLVTTMAARLGLAPGSRGYLGVCLTSILASYYIGATILTANAPNLVLAGAAESLHEIPLRYTSYLWALFPVLGVLKLGVLWLLMAKLFAAPLQESPRDAAAARPLDGPQRRLAVLLTLTLLGWLTDSLHQIHPAWISLTAVAVCLLPRVGVLPTSALNNPINIGPLLYLAAALGIGALIDHSGLVDVFAERISTVMALAESRDYAHYVKVGLFTTLAGLFTTNPGLPALTVPLTVPLLGQSGWSVEAGLMLTAVGYTTLLAPYQSPPIVIGLHVAGIPMRRALLITLALGVLSIVLLWPLNYLWWRLFGLLA